MLKSHGGEAVGVVGEDQVGTVPLDGSIQERSESGDLGVVWFMGASRRPTQEVNGQAIEVELKMRGRIRPQAGAVGLEEVISGVPMATSPFSASQREGSSSGPVARVVPVSTSTVNPERIRPSTNRRWA